jgi:GDP-L-fucose synthase
LARAAVHIMNIDKKLFNKHCSLMSSHLNVGSSKDLTIKELVEIIKKVVGYNGEINFDKTKPDGNCRKLLNSERVNNLGFKPEIGLKDGLIKTYESFLKINANF